jgi:hypothetical protein
MRMIRQRGNRDENYHWEIETRMFTVQYEIWMRMTSRK